MIQAELGQELETYVEQLVAKGAFPSQEAALRAGIRLIREREEAQAAFDAAIAEGIADVESGRVHTLEDVRDRLRARSTADLSARR